MSSCDRQIYTSLIFSYRVEQLHDVCTDADDGCSFSIDNGSTKIDQYTGP